MMNVWQQFSFMNSFFFPPFVHTVQNIAPSEKQNQERSIAHSFLNDCSFLWSLYSFWQSLLDFFAGGSFAPVTNFHMFEKRKLKKIRVITGNSIGIRFRSNINNAKVLMIVYLKSFILIAIVRGNLGKSTPKI